MDNNYSPRTLKGPATGLKPACAGFKPGLFTLRTCQLLLCSSLFLLAVGKKVQGQIIPDRTLGPESSVVRNNVPVRGEPADLIEGGAIRGENVFHSFSEFNVGQLQRVYFANPAGIENIFSRVTGNNISQIMGRLGVDGGASMFVINPNGIIFGPNARLDVGGSFISSTANSVEFDRYQFSATNPVAPPLLTINVPLGLQYGPNPGAIRVEGSGHNIIPSPTPGLLPINRPPTADGLQVGPLQTLALIGGDVTLDGGTLTADSGRIELGSVSNGFVSLKRTEIGWNLGYEEFTQYGDIRLQNAALADASGEIGGEIIVRGGNLFMSGGAWIGIQDRGSQPSGSISINMSNNIDMIGISPNGINTAVRTEALADGRGGNISVLARNLSIIDGAFIASFTFSNLAGGRGGDIAVSVAEEVQFLRFARNNQVSSIFTTTFASQDAGETRLLTRRMTLQDGGVLTSSSFGTGKGGDVTVNAAESIELSGTNINNNIFPSGFGSIAGNAGDAGDLTVNTSDLVVTNGSTVSTSSFASGNAGNVTINATNSVEISGVGPGSIIPAQVDSSALRRSQSFRDFLGLPDRPSGNSGQVTINTRILKVTDGGIVNVRNDGTGDAGTIEINADAIFLDDKGEITAVTRSGNGGNIQLHVADALILRSLSAITARAGTELSGGGDGGNITIDSGTLVALEGSNINANAFEGNGGNILITTSGIFLAPDSQITASSQLGVDGTVEVSTPDMDPAAGLVELGKRPIDVEQLIGKDFCKLSRDSSFIATGRGGLPESPLEELQPHVVWQDLRLTPPFPRGDETSTPIQQSRTIVEAQGLVTDANGNAVLTAYPPVVTPVGTWLHPVDCQMLRSNGDR
ncbi:MAG: filamentous hemagglutinin N-terminal domain-containing protein [Hormoscilla sp.]